MLATKLDDPSLLRVRSGIGKRDKNSAACMSLEYSKCISCADTSKHHLCNGEDAVIGMDSSLNISLIGIESVKMVKLFP